MAARPREGDAKVKRLRHAAPESVNSLRTSGATADTRSVWLGFARL